MNIFCRRAARRVQVAIRAVVSDRNQTNCLNCYIRDASTSGRKIVSSRIADLPNAVLLEVAGMKEKIKGHIAWRNGRMAGVEFDWSNALDLDRRRELRIAVELPAMVTDRGHANGVGCVIRDASRSGCRIFCERVAELPDKISLSVQSVSEPIAGTIVWRTADMAGVEFVWSMARRRSQSIDPEQKSAETFFV